MTSSNNNRIIAIWLFICCATIYFMVVLGGATRLTGSGLSMVEWAPIMGVIPPMTHAEWLEAFQLYQQYPEYKIKNPDMTLSGFQFIFWFEYSHRLLGRFIGILFFFPMVFFFIKGWVKSSLKPKLIAMFILGGLQGLLGWYMVKSGLVDNPHVSQYRLVAHLGLAVFVYAYILWIALDLFYEQKTPSTKTFNAGGLKRYASFLGIFTFIVLLSGGFVAGLKAGHTYNTFPLMDGKWIPDGLFTIQPVWLNFFENITTVQFDHRVLATLLFLAVIIFYIKAMRRKPPAQLKVVLHLMLAMLLVQVSLGISTLLLHVPVALASSHQAGALILLTLILLATHHIRRL
ncbi:MAG: Heme A synthase, cytochrome oxidase biogenesis protein Cox15-CtaA [uncultured Thiotrichaceae bacterium]|uniref:Heme A synthase, cytochrome oxidase biogenesis protein Cox15-CtaA n=1 Tax=uncultured Thiotrichaceae bacterium TaxID=298394 RepID=A0A6S6T1F2_9GAMM|nr:MAG: Heme A synthase, cytochrome oxidase biogenesis protein Cox15-CtaA [uncultured Thiotrichaceae bacterium]